MRKPLDRLDTGSLVVAAITLVLFLAALAVKGLSHEILLEAGVFLISVKLMLMVYKQSVAAEDLKRQMARITDALNRIERRLDQH